MKKVRFLLAAAIALVLCWTVQRPWPVRGARIPPAVKFLSPFTGFWTSGRSLDELPGDTRLPGLQGRVAVLWDERRVAHLFAENDHDAWYMQGWLTARDRLWQMEFQAAVAAGRLSEIVGASALDMDRYHRRIGLVQAAEAGLAAAREDPLTDGALAAYAAGVNAWIEGLTADTLPLEYKILDYRPEPWNGLKTSLLMKSMSLTLSGRNNERAMTLTREILGAAETGRLFPAQRPYNEPIVPAGTAWNIHPAASRTPAGEPPALSGWEFLPEEEEPEEGSGHARGSNQWAVAGSRTESGLPILASDPHLPLTLPSLWYEIQITTPEYSAYGVSIPGAPGVINGFNRQIAWGETNGEDDVLDQYLLQFRDKTYRAYRHDGAWKPVVTVHEEYRVRDGRVHREEIRWTHHGPVPYLPGEKPFRSDLVPGAAMRWTAHDPSNELRTFLELNRATDYESFRQAVSHFDNPLQNFVFASRRGDIAVHHEGRLPIRRPGQGVYLSDGTDSGAEWQGWIPREHLPRDLNPARGYVGSANQNPVSGGYPYFLGDDFAPWERGARVFQLLDPMVAVTPERMLAMQNDAVGLYARKLLPELLAALEGYEGSGPEQEAAGILEEWSHDYDAGAVGATLFDRWQRELTNRIWLDEIRTDGATGRRPGRDMTLRMILEEPDSRYFDDRETEEEETFRDLAVASFRDAVSSLEEKLGAIGEAWRWGSVRPTRLPHLGRIPGLGRTGLSVSGQYGTIRATTSSSGQSWRMVVALGDPPQAWGIYPGGQSGHPGSEHYDDFVDRWAGGEAYPLHFPASPGGPGFKAAGHAVFWGR